MEVVVEVEADDELAYFIKYMKMDGTHHDGLNLSLAHEGSGLYFRLASWGLCFEYLMKQDKRVDIKRTSTF